MPDPDVMGTLKIVSNIANFSRLKTEGCVYVDKAEFVHRILADDCPRLFLSRPRRFGKTLLIDTLEEVAAGRKELFSGLAVDGLRGEDWWPRLHVFRISMNSFGDAPALPEQKLSGYLHLFAPKRGIDIPGRSSDGSLYQVVEYIFKNFDTVPLVTRKICRQDGLPADRMRTIELIDEYDAQIINNLAEPENLIIAQKTRHGFCKALKCYEEMIDRIFITGITKFSQLSFFSALNNLEDISFCPRYVTACGLTFDEIQRFHSPKLDDCLSGMQKKDKKFGSGLTGSKLNARIGEWHDVYSWHGGIHVINPFSFQKFLATRKFRNFWSQTGENNFITKSNLKDEIFDSVFNGKSKFSGSVSIQDAGKIAPVSLMLQTGDLTVRAQRIPSTESRLFLAVSNLETGMTVMEEFANSRALSAISSGKDGFTPKIYREFHEGFFRCDNEKAEKLLQGILSVIPFRLHLEYEAFYRVIILSVFRFADFVDDLGADAEDNKSGGIIGLVIEAPGYGIFVSENKFSRSERSVCPDDGISQNAASQIPSVSDKDDRNLDACTKDAFAQIVENGNALPFLNGEMPFYAIAVAVCGWTQVRIRRCPAAGLLARACEFTGPPDFPKGSSAKANTRAFNAGGRLPGATA
ncbi:MAG: AAA family ATPase [Deltaproteobacteria bacterium]|jgi:hypothetical protein|nr:AAA family ATPase [Deltaproteobacteria bacterium]